MSGQNSWVEEEAPIFKPDGAMTLVKLERHADGFPFTDPWGVGARQAWARCDFHGKVVAFLGVGAGAEVVQALYNGQVPRTMFLNDIVGLNLDACTSNIYQALVLGPTATYPQVVLLPGRAEEVLKSPQVETLDWICGCLPQVPGGEPLSPEMVAHLYSASSYPALAKWGLGLIASVLEASRSTLGLRGKVSLVVSGRIPWGIVQQTFLGNGFRTPTVAHQFMVRHHTGTPLSYLEGHAGAILFRDPEGTDPILPEFAEAERQEVERGQRPVEDFHVYHWVNIVEASPRLFS